MSTEKFPSGIAPDNHDLELLARGEHHDPHSVLGAHPHADGTVLRALRPNAESVSAVIGGKTFLSNMFRTESSRLWSPTPT